MRNKFVVWAAVIAIVFTGSACLAAGFQARYKTLSEGKTTTGNMWMTGAKVRMETSMGIIISRPDKKLTWILMPDQKAYMEQAYSSANSQGTDKKMDGEVSRTKIGKETVSGLSCTKYRITVKHGEETQAFLQWIHPSMPAPVKTQAEDGSWSMEFSEILTGNQPASMFEIPAGYTMMDSMPTPAGASGERE